MEETSVVVQAFTVEAVEAADETPYFANVWKEAQNVFWAQREASAGITKVKDLLKKAENECSRRMDIEKAKTANMARNFQNLQQTCNELQARIDVLEASSSKKLQTSSSKKRHREREEKIQATVLATVPATVPATVEVTPQQKTRDLLDRLDALFQDAQETACQKCCQANQHITMACNERIVNAVDARIAASRKNTTLETFAVICAKCTEAKCKRLAKSLRSAR
jgi:uncharacterized protein YlxW (UPF0749 family)